MNGLKKLIIYLEGILLGFVSLAIPGLSASTIALEIDIYYDMIDAISNIFKKFKKSIVFLAILIAGYATGCFLGAISITTAYKAFPLVVVLTILGFVVGGMPEMIKKMIADFKKISCWIVLIVITILIILFSMVVTEGQRITFVDMKILDYIILFFVGFITASTLVIPGVDFAVVLLSLGYYYAFTDLIANIFDFSMIGEHLLILGIYLVGYGIGTFLFSKVIKILMNKYPSQANFASFAFVLTAPFIVIEKCVVENENFTYTNTQLVVGIILFVIGFLLIFLAPKVLKNLKNKQRKRKS